MFLQPGALLVLAGVGTLIHYNDERRAISKGLLYFLVFFVVFGNIMYAFQKMLILCILLRSVMHMYTQHWEYHKQAYKHQKHPQSSLISMRERELNWLFI